MLGIDLEHPSVTHHAARKGTEGDLGSWDVPTVALPLPGVGDIKTPAKVMDIIYDGNIGAPLIERLRWQLDLRHRQVSISAP